MMTEQRTEYYLRMAKATPDEVEKLRQFMADLEEKIDDIGFDRDYRDLGEWVCNNLPEWRRTVEGYPILVENACDPALTYLDWRPEIKERDAELTTLSVENEALCEALKRIATGVPGRSTAESWLSASEMADIAAGALAKGGE